jgi:hypothetical protein
LGLPGFQIRDLIIKDPGFIRYKWRARVEYPMHNMIDGQRFSRWFYGYASAVGDIGILPIELATFDGTAEDDGNLLSWSTASERGTDRFIVLRGLGPDHFDPIGSVQAAGESSQMLGYRFLDNNAPDGLSYYRLRVMDLDGNEALSPIISVLRQGGEIVLYPVPVKNELRWSLTGNEPSRALVLDALGRVVIDAGVTGNSLTGKGVAQLAHGSYTLLLLDGADGILARSRFVKD